MNKVLQTLLLWRFMKKGTIMVVILYFFQLLTYRMAVIVENKKEKEQMFNQGKEKTSIWVLPLKTEDKEISGICGTKVASCETNILIEVSLFGHSIWIKEYRHLTMFKTGYNARLLSPQHCYQLSCNLIHSSRQRFYLSQNPLKSFKYANKRTPAGFGRQKRGPVLFSRSGCSRLCHRNFLTSNWELLILCCRLSQSSLLLRGSWVLWQLPSEPWRINFDAYFRGCLDI